MLGFAGALGDVPFDAALVEGDDVVSYVSRDSSKPGRSGELWTVYATPAYAERTLTAAAAEEDPRAALQSKTPELVAAVSRLFSPWVPELPAPAVAVPHRWGAAFPSKPEGGTPPAISELGGRFVAVGDYLVGPRVEGAAASAEAGARLLIEACA